MPRLTPAVKFIIALTTGVYVAQLLLPAAFTRALMLVPADVLRQGHVWELVTYMFVHSTNPWHVVMNMLTLYFFGGEVESAWGTRRFAGFYVLCGLGAALCAFILDPGYALLGASGAVFGVMVAFACLFPDAVILFFGMIPMRAPHMVGLFIFIEMAMIVQPGSASSTWAHLGGAATGYLYVRFSWRVVQWWKRTFGDAPRSARSAGVAPTRRSARPTPPRPGGGGASVSTLPTKTAPKSVAVVAASAEELAIQRRADDILDKISREGMESLTRDEREVLARHSQILKSREGDVLRLDDYRS